MEEPTVFCDHCRQYVHRTTVHRHKRKHQPGSGGPLYPSEDGQRNGKQKQVYCNHCNKLVSRATLFRHQKLLDQSRASRSPELTSDSEWSSDDNITNHEDNDNAHDMMQSPTSTGFTESSSSTESDTDECGDSVWEDEDDESVSADLTQPKERPEQKSASLLNWFLYSLLYLQSLHSLSNACVENILFLILQLLTTLVMTQPSRMLSSFVEMFPKSINKLKLFLNINDNDFGKFVVCRNCYSLHSYESVLTDGHIICKNTVFASKAIDSSRKRGRVKCNGVLARQVILKNEKKVLYPYKVYCLKGVISGLERLLSRSDFLDKCNSWRSRNVGDLYADVFDGKVWKSFVGHDGSDFLFKNYHFGFALNCDWFAPYKRRRDVSIGVLYMVVLNLPREERFKTENVILVGIIPALKKEPETLNPFLKPIVRELKALWRGVLMTVQGYDQPVPVKAALMCAAADIPAARKLCGFMGHSARQGCSHCTKPFINPSGGKNCGIPNLDIWPKRNRIDHLKYSDQANQTSSIAAKTLIESKYGYRYTELLDLDYFVPCEFYSLDPMHNLFLGTAKRMFSHWVEQDILTKASLQLISEKIVKLNVNSDVGRIPINIASNYSQMTAKEWKNWVLVYSLFALQGSLPLPHLQVWQTFVLGCKHLCKPVVTKDGVEVAHGLFVKFVKEVSRLYGPSFVTPNMHLHCHLKQSVENFGSIYSFWLFSFERYNGMLAGFPTNKRSIECQLMRKFETMSSVSPFVVLNDHQEKLSSLFDRTRTKVVKTVSLELFNCANLPGLFVDTQVWSDLSSSSLSGQSFKLINLTANNLGNLRETYSHMYLDLNLDLKQLSSVAKKYDSIEIGKCLFSSRNRSTENSDLIWASWADENSNIGSFCSRPAKIKHFLIHTVELENGFCTHVFAVVEWYCRATHFDKLYLSPFSVWSSRTQNEGPATYLPIQRIQSKCAWTKEVVNGHPCLVVCDLPYKLYV